MVIFIFLNFQYTFLQAVELNIIPKSEKKEKRTGILFHFSPFTIVKVAQLDQCFKQLYF